MRLIDAHMSLCKQHSLTWRCVQIANAQNAHATERRKKTPDEGFENGIKKETTKKVKIEMGRKEKRIKKKIGIIPSSFVIHNSQFIEYNHHVNKSTEMGTSNVFKQEEKNCNISNKIFDWISFSIFCR